MTWSYKSAIAYAQPLVVANYQSGHRSVDEPFESIGHDGVTEESLEAEFKAAATAVLGEDHGITVKHFTMRYSMHAGGGPTLNSMYLVHEQHYDETGVSSDCVYNEMRDYPLDLSVPENVNQRFAMLVDAFELTPKSPPGWYKIECLTGHFR